MPTAEFASLVYGPGGVPLDDCVEAFHEASRLYPNLAPRRLASLVELARSPELQTTVARAGRVHDHRPGIDLPAVPLPDVLLRSAIDDRTSGLGVADNALEVTEVSTILAAGYRATKRPTVGWRRPVPSAGALYPLELYALVREVDGLEAGAYHYHPFRHRLEWLGPFEPERLQGAFVDREIAERAAALLVVTTMIWRSRFKYGERGYRFALLEAGHAAQNMVLAATALALAALPLGGFYDRRLDELVGADGLDEATVYAIALGGRR